MSSSPERFELLAWIAQERRTYPEAIEVWKTHCPRHSLWEDAVADGLVEVVRNGARSYVVLSEAGEAVLRRGLEPTDRVADRDGSRLDDERIHAA